MPTVGSGTIAAAPMVLADGSMAMNIDFTKVVDLALNYTSVTTEPSSRTMGAAAIVPEPSVGTRRNLPSFSENFYPG